MSKLKGRVALITGGGQGVGLGIAGALAAAGASIAITGRDAAKLQAAAEGLARAGVEVLTVAGDSRKRADAQAAVAATIQRFGRLDVLVNNAQSSITGIALEDYTDEQIATILESGLLGTLYFMQAAFPHLKERGGSIINLGSKEGVVGGKGFGVYAATKEGVRGLSRTAAREWGRYKIRVNVINPAALSPAAVSFLANNREYALELAQTIPLGRVGDPLADIGPVALFLASDDSQYVTGQTINTDGGQVML
jgi:NAD(P)-dependent dehydrogenase (short-subunit alcohol dehydrogenase family)